MTATRPTPQPAPTEPVRVPSGHGGWRPGAGRPRGRTTASHGRRAAFAAEEPQHVTLQLADGVRSLRSERMARIIREVIAVSHRDGFRIVHFGVIEDHVELIVEADDERALARGMQGFGIRLARNVNAAQGRLGKLFTERYHARALKTPKEVRAALRYVLLDARHHAKEAVGPDWIDPSSSALWFDGWREAIRTDAPALKRLAKETRPTAEPRTALLTSGWRRGGGAIGFDDVLGARDRASIEARVDRVDLAP